MREGLELDVVRRAVQAKRLSEQILNEQGYLYAIKAQLSSLERDR